MIFKYTFRNLDRSLIKIILHHSFLVLGIFILIAMHHTYWHLRELRLFIIFLGGHSVPQDQQLIPFWLLDIPILSSVRVFLIIKQNRFVKLLKWRFSGIHFFELGFRLFSRFLKNK